VKRPCLGCGRIIASGSRCVACTTPMYRGDYAARARLVRDTATACWLCGEGYRTGDPWQADHVTASPDSELRPAHRSCNARRGKPS
jgi:hypothetical protein